MLKLDRICRNFATIFRNWKKIMDIYRKCSKFAEFSETE